MPLVLSSFMSTSHALAAAYMSKEVETIESKYEQTSALALLNVRAQHSAFAAASIVASVSFLEAYINELFWSAADAGAEKSAIPGLTKSQTRRLGSLWSHGIPRTAHYRIVDKYDIALALIDKPSFDASAMPYQDVCVLIKLRNALVHYEPEWVEIPEHPGEQVQQQQIEKTLRSRNLKLNPLAYHHDPFFPDRCLSYGCTRWAIERSREFVDQFSAKLGVEPTYKSSLRLLGLLP